MKKHINDILLVDDDAITNFLNENLLQEMHVAEHIAVVYDGAKALDFIKSHWTCGSTAIDSPENKMILLDINMTYMNGFEFLEQFETISKSHQVTVALLTSSRNTKDISRAAAYHIQDYIEKPLNRDKVESLFGKLSE